MPTKNMIKAMSPMSLSVGLIGQDPGFNGCSDKADEWAYHGLPLDNAAIL